MILKLTGAALRGFLVALMVALPALILPNVPSDTAQVTVLVAMLAALMICVEYLVSCPSLIEFRQAPPLNRLRFCGAFLTVFLLASLCAGKSEPTLATGALASVARLVDLALDFPYSPVRLVVLALPAETTAMHLRSVRDAAALSYAIALGVMLTFWIAVRVFGWPTARSGPFNVWVNLPHFDPTAGGDVLWRLRRDAWVYLIIGALAPFALPAVALAIDSVIRPVTLHDPLVLIWAMTLWAFLPASLVMRGIAMGRIADLIQQKRQRSYAEASAYQLA